VLASGGGRASLLAAFCQQTSQIQVHIFIEFPNYDKLFAKQQEVVCLA
jgi:hypothetical protein